MNSELKSGSVDKNDKQSDIVIFGIDPESGSREYDKLTEKVRDGEINREEFKDLMKTITETERLKTKEKEGDLTQKELAQLKFYETQYKLKFGDPDHQYYLEGDYHPEVTADNEFFKKQIEQFDKIFNSIKGGGLTRKEAARLIEQQKDIARTMGSFKENNDALSRKHKGVILEKLGDAEKDIFILDKNSERVDILKLSKT
ncbi:MAG: hypothetical protein K8T10_13885 [Candidatus Eremiobacteraeota bacterium]|nr:hypothetical protein [Candidatus Eremiobacteraeota bacterium]